MNEKPDSIWKKRVLGWPLCLAWFLILVAAVFVIFYCSYLGRDMSNLGWSVFTVVVGLSLYVSVRWLCHWRNLKKVLFVIASLVTLFALIHAEENWRGYRAWSHFKHEQEALGFRFELPLLAPPAVPEDQNFATTPIVYSSYSAWMDRKGNRLTNYDHSAIDRLKMPMDAGNPPEQSFGDWQKGELCPSLEILQKYYRDLSAKTNFFPVPAQPKSPAEDILLALSKYDAQIEELRQASLLPYSRFPLEYNKDNPAEILLPHLASCKSAAYTLRIRAIAELQCGQADKALDDILLVLRLGESIRSGPFLIDHLVDVAIFNLAMQPIYEGLARRSWSDAQLATLSARLSQADFLADYRTAMESEMAFSIGIVEYVRRIRNLEVFRMIENVGENGDTLNNLSYKGKALLFRILVPNGIFYQNELAMAKMYLRYSFPMIDAQRRLVFPRINQGDFPELEHVSPYNFLSRKLFPAIMGSSIKFAFAQSAADQARLAIALERYRLVHGDYPETLAPLAPQFIAAIPHDLMNGQPLHYRIEAGGRFILYSVGWNQKDDGGNIVFNKNKKGENQSVNRNQGDWVWKYPAGN